MSNGFGRDLIISSLILSLQVLGSVFVDGFHAKTVFRHVALLLILTIVGRQRSQAAQSGRTNDKRWKEVRPCQDMQAHTRTPFFMQTTELN